MSESHIPETHIPETRIVDLPDPRRAGEMSLEEALAARRSVREYTAEPVALAAVGQLLWAAQGRTAGHGGRTAPSAGALYPLELYVASRSGLFRYLPDSHRLERRSPDDVRAAVARAGLDQDPLRDAPVVFAVAAVPGRTTRRYGGRAERYVLLEAGHAVQDMLLQAVALGLGAVPVGAFDDDALAEALALPPDEQPLYLVPVGHPAAP